MAKVLVLYVSDYGSTKKIAEKVAEGVTSIDGAEVLIKTAEEASAEDMISSDAVIVGSPVHMGSPDWRVKKFIDEICSGLWVKDLMAGKVGAVFATGSGYGRGGGGAELTMLAMLANFAELGMIIVPFPKQTPGYGENGLHWGPYAPTADPDMKPIGPSDNALASAKHHGANVARVAIKIGGTVEFAK